MFWRDIISVWLSNKTRQDRSIFDLMRSLVETNIIPETLVDNSMLQTMLLTQIMLETLNGLSVPEETNVGSRRKKCQTNRNVGKTNGSELGPLL